MGMYFYGERGLVYGIVLDLKDDLELSKVFLKSINFCNSYNPIWIDKVQKVDFIIEPSFSEFGDPDLIIVCYCENDERHIIFLEAKVVSYEDSAVNLQLKNHNGINSRINAQLTLKYRLVKALEIRFKEEYIQENKQYWQNSYSKLHTETSGIPRRIKNGKVLELCDEFFISASDFWYVALVNNKKEDRPFDDCSLRPLLYNMKGENIWELERQQFGIITYMKLNEIMSPTGNYIKAKKYTTIPSPAEQVIKDIHTIKIMKWTNFSDFIQFKLRKVLQELVQKAICVNEMSSDTHPLNGSDSYKSAGRTIIKLIPQRTETGEKIILAIRKSFYDLVIAGEAIVDEKPFMVGVGKNSRCFVGINIIDCPTGEKINNMTAILKEVWRTAVEQ